MLMKAPSLTVGLTAPFHIAMPEAVKAPQDASKWDPSKRLRCFSSFE